MVVKIVGRVVFICGPICTGKTSFVKRLMASCPLGLGTCISLDMRKMSSREKLEYMSKKVKDIVNSMKSDCFTVIKCEHMSGVELQSLLTTVKILGEPQMMQVIKFSCDESVHINYVREHYKRMSIRAVKKDRKLFKSILENDYTSEKVMQTTVTNSTEIDGIEFNIQL